MKVKLNDKVLVISGKDKGKTGKIMRVIAKDNKVVVEKMNMRTKHIKKTMSQAGQKVTFEAPMSVANVAVVCPGCSKPTRVGYKALENGKKERVCKKCNQTVDQTVSEGSGRKASTKKIKV